MNHKPAIKVVTREEIRQQLDDLMNQVIDHGVQISVEDDGEAVAGLISANDLARLRQYEEEIAHGEELLKRMRQPFEHLDSKQIEDDVEEIVAEVRRELREKFKASAGQ